uniref:Uncharacterized protein n=1 Tax=Plectus sambesii TaxID=2011161 RepID=A0A914X0D3_9BILA
MRSFNSALLLATVIVLLLVLLPQPLTAQDTDLDDDYYWRRINRGFRWSLLQRNQDQDEGNGGAPSGGVDVNRQSFRGK